MKEREDSIKRAHPCRILSRYAYSYKYYQTQAWKCCARLILSLPIPPWAVVVEVKQGLVEDKDNAWHEFKAGDRQPDWLHSD